MYSVSGGIQSQVWAFCTCYGQKPQVHYNMAGCTRENMRVVCWFLNENCKDAVVCIDKTKHTSMLPLVVMTLSTIPTHM